MNRQTPLRAWPWAVLALLAVPLAACGESETDPTTSATATATATATASGSFFASDGLDADGYWEGVRATDYVQMWDFAAFTIPYDAWQVTDDEVETEIASLLSDYSASAQVYDRAVQDGDTVNIDYVGSIDGVEFSGGSTGGAGTDVTAGSTEYIDDFLTQIIGHMPGETMDVNVTFPTDYSSTELAGKDALFVVTINYITETVAPTLTDEWVASTFAGEGWTTVAEMRAGVRANLEKIAAQNYIYDYLIANVTVTEVPAALIQYQVDSMVDWYQAYADYYGYTLEDYILMTTGYSTIEELAVASSAENEEYARYSLIVQAVAETAGIKATDADVADYFLTQMGLTDYSTYEADYGLPYLKQVVMSRMVMDYLYEQATLATA
jgi:trigger factor